MLETPAKELTNPNFSHKGYKTKPGSHKWQVISPICWNLTAQKIAWGVAPLWSSYRGSLESELEVICYTLCHCVLFHCLIGRGNPTATASRFWGAPCTPNSYGGPESWPGSSYRYGPCRLVELTDPVRWWSLCELKKLRNRTLAWYKRK